MEKELLLIEELIETKRFDKALLKAKELIGIATLNNDVSFLALANLKAGIVFYELQKYHEAESYLLNAIKFFKELNDKENLADVRNRLAISYARLQKNYKAKELFEKNVEYYKSKRNTEKIIASLLNIATIYKAIGKLEYSIGVFQECLKILKKEKNSQMIPMLLYNLGNSYLEANNIDKAFEYLNMAISEAEKQNNKNVLARAYDSLAGVYFSQNKFDIALEKEEEASRIANNIYNKMLFINIQLNKAQIYFTLNNTKKALEILNLIFEDIKDLDNLQLMVKYYFLRSKICENNGDFREAYYSLIEYNKILQQINKDTTKILNKSQEKTNRVLEELKNEQKKVEDMKTIEKQKLLLMQKSKLESLGQLAAGIAHEINQPLGAITFGLDNIYFRFEQNNLTKEYLKNKCRILKYNLSRISKIIGQMRTFSQTQNFFKMEKLDINQLIEDTMILLRTQYKNHNIELKLELSENLGFTIGSKNQMEQVLLNLLSNARYAVESKYKKSKDFNYKKEILIRTYSDKNKIYIEIEDNGIGISQADMFKIFDPFYTTKDVDHGTGLGLSISLGIVEKMKGKIELKSEIDKYTVAKITLPKYMKKNESAE